VGASLASNALTTVAKVKDDLGLTDSTKDSVVIRMINSASSAIENYCRRTFGRATETQTLRGSGTHELALARTPLVSITSVAFDGETDSSGNYKIHDADAGLVWKDSTWIPEPPWYPGASGFPVVGAGERLYSVVYVGGYILPKDGKADGTTTLPADLEEACILTAVSQYRNRGGDRRVTSKALGDASVAYGGINTAIGRGLGGIIPDEAVFMLAPYRRHTEE
jgi:hypothetical protein